MDVNPISHTMADCDDYVKKEKRRNVVEMEANLSIMTLQNIEKALDQTFLKNRKRFNGNILTYGDFNDQSKYPLHNENNPPFLGSTNKEQFKRFCDEAYKAGNPTVHEIFCLGNVAMHSAEFSLNKVEDGAILAEMIKQMDKFGGRDFNFCTADSVNSYELMCYRTSAYFSNRSYYSNISPVQGGTVLFLRT